MQCDEDHDEDEVRVLYLGGEVYRKVCKLHWLEAVEEVFGTPACVPWEMLPLAEPPYDAKMASFWYVALMSLAQEQDVPEVIAILTSECMSLMLADYLTAPINDGEPI